MKKFNLKKYTNLRNKVKLLNQKRLNKYINEYYNKFNYNQSERLYYYEYINNDMIDFILDNKERINAILNRTNGEINYTYNILKILKELNIKGYHKTYYYKTKNKREYANNNISLGLIVREIRQLLCYNTYYDIDVENCHPTILLFLCKTYNRKKKNRKNKIKYEYIKKYVNDRENIIKEIRNKTGTTREDVKISILSIINGGIIAYNKLKKSKFIRKFHKECKVFREKIKKEHEEQYENLILNLKNDDKFKNKNENQLDIMATRTLISHELTSVESEILDNLIKYSKGKGLIKNNCVIKIFDGFQIMKKSVTREKLEEHILKMEEIIKKEMKLDIKIKIKEFKECDKIIKKIPEIKNHMEDKFSQNELSEIIKKNKFNIKRQLSMINNSKKFDLTEYKEDEYKIIKKTRLPKYEKEIKENDSLYIISPMGSGKTKQLYDYINVMDNDPKLKNKSICFISFRRSLEKKYIQDLKSFKLYSSIKGPINKKEHPRIAIQINSIKRITSTYDYVILDEISYTLSTLINFCDNKKQVHDILEQLIQNSEKIICMDANMQNSDINFIENILNSKNNENKKNRSKFIIYNKNTKHRGDIYLYKRKEFTNDIMKNLSNGKKIALASNSNTFLTNLEALLIYDGIKYLKINKETDEKYFDTDIWDQYDIIMYTPTITAGVSFEKKHYNMRYGYFSSLSSSAALSAQQLFRVRDTTDKNIHLCINQIKDREKKYEDTFEEVEEYLNRTINLDQNVIKDAISLSRDEGLLNLDLKERKFKKDNYYNLLINYMVKINKSKNEYFEELAYYLAIQGFFFATKEKNTGDKSANTIKPEDIYKIIDDHKKKIEKNDMLLYKNNEAPDHEEMKKIKLKERKSKMDVIKMKLYDLKCQNISIKGKKDKEIKLILENLSNTRFDSIMVNNKIKDKKNIKFLLEKLIKIFNKDEDEYNMSFYNYDEETEEISCEKMKELIYESSKYDLHNQRARDYYLKCFHSINIIRLLGFKHNNDFKTSLQLNIENYERVHTYITRYWDNFEILFKMEEKYKQLEIFAGSKVMIKINNIIKIINRKIHFNKRTRGKGGKRRRVYVLEKFIEI